MYDSLIIFYANEKFQTYTYKFENSFDPDSRNILDGLLFGGLEQRYELTSEDYLNSLECSTNCK